MNASDLVNWGEVVLWPTLGITCVVGSLRKHGRISWKIWILALAFGLFGLSDYMELRTGAWWRPWWLLALKVGCTSVFILAGWDHYRNEQRKAAEKRDAEDGEHQ